jgi:hypothetical protein
VEAIKHVDAVAEFMACAMGERKCRQAMAMRAQATLMRDTTERQNCSKAR